MAVLNNQMVRPEIGIPVWLDGFSRIDITIYHALTWGPQRWEIEKMSLAIIDDSEIGVMCTN